jgi:hypothetical protein
MAEPDLFRTREQVTEEACAIQEERIAYVDAEPRGAPSEASR